MGKPPPPLLSHLASSHPPIQTAPHHTHYIARSLFIRPVHFIFKALGHLLTREPRVHHVRFKFVHTNCTYYAPSIGKVHETRVLRPQRQRYNNGGTYRDRSRSLCSWQARAHKRTYKHNSSTTPHHSVLARHVFVCTIIMYDAARSCAPHETGSNDSEWRSWQTVCSNTNTKMVLRAGIVVSV